MDSEERGMHLFTHSEGFRDIKPVFGLSKNDRQRHQIFEDTIPFNKNVRSVQVDNAIIVLSPNPFHVFKLIYNP